MTDKISGNGQVPKVGFEGNNEIAKQKTVSSASDKVIDNLDKDNAALVGRSMVIMSKAPKFDGKLVANIKNDIEALNANYKQNKNAVLLTDAAIAKGIPYEDAVKIGQEFIDMQKA